MNLFLYYPVKYVKFIFIYYNFKETIPYYMAYINTNVSYSAIFETLQKLIVFIGEDMHQ